MLEELLKKALGGPTDNPPPKQELGDNQKAVVEMLKGLSEEGAGNLLKLFKKIQGE